MAISVKLYPIPGMDITREQAALAPFVSTAHHLLHEKKGTGSEFLGWLDLPLESREDELLRIQAAARQIREQSRALVVIGIGGSYWGAKAALEFIHSPAYNEIRPKGCPAIYFAGQHISGNELHTLLTLIGEQDFSINVISKSGTTTEPAIAFRILRRLLIERYGQEGAAQRIFVTTDASKGALRTLADREGYESFVIPDDIGGRYSVLTAVGLLPMAAAGIDIEAVLGGAAVAHAVYQTDHLAENPCYQYAVMRNLLSRRGYTVELWADYEPQLVAFSSWFSQLFAESEGKDGKGVFPAAVHFSTDLHSVGQFIQEGSRFFFETVLWCNTARHTLSIPLEEEDGDGLNFLAEKSIAFVNQKAFEGTLLAHLDGGVPVTVISFDEMDAAHFGQLVYFFEKAAAMSGYLLGVNPFDQPGVEAYKKNMFALLGKPGYEQQAQALKERLKK